MAVAPDINSMRALGRIFTDVRYYVTSIRADSPQTIPKKTAAGRSGNGSYQQVDNAVGMAVLGRFPDQPHDNILTVEALFETK